MTLLVTLSSPMSVPVNVDYATLDGSAVAGTDYMGASGMLTFAPGQTSQSINVQILDKGDYSGQSVAFSVLLSPMTTGISLGSPGTATVTILDNDATPTVQFSAATYSTNESTGMATLVVMLSNPSTQTVTVNYATSDGTATAPTDYLPTSGTMSFDLSDIDLFGGGTLTFAPGVVSQQLQVPVVSNSGYGPPITFNVTLSSPTNAVLGSPAAAVVSIVPDVLPTVQFASANFAAYQSCGTVAITVTLSMPSTETISINYATNEGTATAPANYSPASGTLSFAPGVASQTFSVSLVQSPPLTGSVDLNLVLSSPVNANLGSPSTAVLAILPGSPPANPSVSFSSTTYSVSNVAGTFATILVNLDTPSSQAVTVSYSTSDGSAQAYFDYLPAAGTLTFPPNVMSQSFQVGLLYDGGSWTNQTVNLSLGNPGNAILGTLNAAVLNIVNCNVCPLGP